MRTAYSKYKASGISWIGDIPEHWAVKRSKYLGKALIGITYSPEDLSDDENGILVLRSSNIQNGKPSTADCVYVNKEVSEKQITRKGDILICARNGSAELVGKNICIDGPFVGVTFGAFMAIYRTKFWRYVYYYLNSDVFKAQTGLFKTSTINQLTNETLESLTITLPLDPNEQEQIANFLDIETAKIDKLVARKHEFIERLKEKRTALISQVVTKGLPTEEVQKYGLPVNPKMKPSGVDWLGEIPEHWTIKRLGALTCKIGSGKTPSGGAEVYQDSGVMLIRSQNVYNDGLRLDDVAFISDELDAELASTRLKPLDVLLNITGASIGRSVVFPAEQPRSNVNQHVCIIRPNHARLESHFLHLFLISSAGQAQISMSENGAAREGLNFQQIRKLRLTLPPMDEQRVIGLYLHKETSLIDKTLRKVESAIDRLSEYRAALITAAVTGKIDVREGAT